jgi:hypothetical protein
MTHVFIPPKGHGLANLFIMLSDFFYNCPGGVVHDSIKDYEMGRWLTFNFPITDRTDLPVYEGKIFINNVTVEHVHPMIRKLVKPSPELEEQLKRHEHLIKDVSFGIHVRRGASAPDSRKVVSRDEDTFASQKAVDEMIQLVKNAPGPVFLASDSPMTKKMFPFNVRTLDTGIAVVHGDVECNSSDRVGIFIDFFLLSKCHLVVVTGGNFPNIPGISTFGYMAAMYGNVKHHFVTN